jgi:glycine/D-amino acid oxidase-like deaminating enzyme
VAAAPREQPPGCWPPGRRPPTGAFLDLCRRSRELGLDWAAELLPELAGYRFSHTWAGLCPHVAGRQPLLGRGGWLLLATAHFRNGGLLAPITGELLVRAILERADPAELEEFSTLRLA